MKFLQDNEMGTYSKAEIDKTKEVELRSRRVVFTELAKKHGLVFHMVLIGGKWYLWLVDTVASDCGA